MTGTPFENEKTPDLSVLAGVRPRIAILPLEKAGEAIARMRSGRENFRMVLTMTEGSRLHQVREGDEENFHGLLRVLGPDEKSGFISPSELRAIVM